MLIPRVTVVSHTDGEEHQMTNVTTSPLYKYRTDVQLPANETDQNVVHTFELFLNGQSAKLYAEVTVLSAEELQRLIDEINELEDHLNWETFDSEGSYDKLVFGTATVEMIIEHVLALENACTWGTFDDPAPEPNYNEDLATILDRMVKIREAIEWEYLSETPH